MSRSSGLTAAPAASRARPRRARSRARRRDRPRAAQRCTSSGSRERPGRTRARAHLAPPQPEQDPALVGRGRARRARRREPAAPARAARAGTAAAVRSCGHATGWPGKAVDERRAVEQRQQRGLVGGGCRRSGRRAARATRGRAAGRPRRRGPAARAARPRARPRGRSTGRRARRPACRPRAQRRLEPATRAACAFSSAPRAPSSGTRSSSPSACGRPRPPARRAAARPHLGGIDLRLVRRPAADEQQRAGAEQRAARYHQTVESRFSSSSTGVV